MSKRIRIPSKQDDLTTLYTQYFTPRDAERSSDESTSLEQPSELRVVESMTVCGITSDLLIHQG